MQHGGRLLKCHHCGATTRAPLREDAGSSTSLGRLHEVLSATFGPPVPNFWTDWLGPAVLIGLSSYYLGWLGFLGSLVVLGVIANAVERERAKLKERRRLAEPCSHGCAGAVADPSRCGRCQREEAARQAERERAKRAEEQALQAKKQKEYDEFKAKVRMPEYLRQIHPEEFERVVCLLFDRMGYQVEQTRYVGDGGVDGVLRRGDKKSLLQCKRVQGSVGEPVVRDLWGTISHHRADEGIIVTTGAVSRQARQWANDKPIRIIELKELTTLFRQHFDESALVPESFQASELTAENGVRNCPHCGRPLRTRRGRRGRFLGCSGYPRCRYTRAVPRR